MQGSTAALLLTVPDTMFYICVPPCVRFGEYVQRTWNILRDKGKIFAGQDNLQRPHNVEVAWSQLSKHAELPPGHIKLPSGCSARNELYCNHALRVLVQTQPYLAFSTLSQQQQRQ